MILWMDLSQYTLNWFALQTFAVAVGAAMLGILVLFRQRWSAESVLFWLCTLTISVWLYSFTWMYASTSEESALFWAKAAYLGVPFIPSTIYHFSCVVLRIARACRARIMALWGLSAFFAYIIVTTDHLIADLYKYPWGYYPKYEWLAVPYIAFFAVAMAMTLARYWTEMRAARPGSVAHQRAKDLLLSFSIAYTASIDFLPKFGVNIYPTGYISIFCFLLLASHVIWRYRLVDITAAFAAEQILETMNEPLIVCDLDEKVRIVNPAFTRLFGYEQREAQGRRVRDFSDDESWRPSLTLENGVRNHESRFHTKDGAEVFVSLSACHLKSSNGREQGYVIVARDITERRRMEQELKGFNETLEERVKLRTKELAKKIQELEWLNMVMMGREERILELKEQLRGASKPAQVPAEKERGKGNGNAAPSANPGH